MAAAATASTTSFATASVTASSIVFAVATAMTISSATGASTTATIAMQPLALLKIVADKQTLYETCSVYREFRRHIGKR